MDEIANEAGLAKRRIAEYCRRKGALAVGVADVAALDRISPEGFSPYDAMPRVKSVIAIGGANAAIVAMPDARLGERRAASRRLGRARR